MKTTFLITSLLAATIAWVAFAGDKTDKPAIPVKKEAPEQPTGPITKTDAEWKKELTPEQYRILRQAGTEAPDGQAYKEFKKQGAGTYYCGGCGAELFSSATKFDSQCGWPSFYDPSKAKNVKTDTDYHLGYARTEVRCAICDGHLGHVFKGERFATLGGKETPTGDRYCINGVALTFVPEGGKAPEKKAPTAPTNAEKQKKEETEK